MKRGPIIHAVLLVFVLGFAYQTWTREKKVEPKTGKVEVWSKPASSLQAVLFETKDRTLRVERRKDDAGSYLWGKETRVSRHHKRPPRPAKGQDAGVPPAEPEVEETTSTREFPAGEAGTELFDNFAQLHALRDLGELSDSDRQDYGLADSTDNITAIFADGQRSLILGGRIYGSSDRYVLDTDTNKGYAVAGAVVRGLTSGESALRVKQLHKFDVDKVDKAELTTGSGASRKLVRTTVKGPKGETKGWADAATPDKHDQTMANFLNSLLNLRPTAYMLELKPDEMTKLIAVDYRDSAGKSLGHFELYKEVEEPATPAEATDPDAPTPPETAPAGAKTTDAKSADAKAADQAKPKPKKPPKVNYYVRTERTRVLGKVGRAQAERVEKDMAEIFESDQPAPAKAPVPGTQPAPAKAPVPGTQPPTGTPVPATPAPVPAKPAPAKPAPAKPPVPSK